MRHESNYRINRGRAMNEQDLQQLQLMIDVRVLKALEHYRTTIVEQMQAMLDEAVKDLRAHIRSEGQRGRVHHTASLTEMTDAIDKRIKQLDGDLATLSARVASPEQWAPTLQ